MPTSESNPAARLIKRYANRKMYDTERSCYVTLEEVAELVRGGIDVRVVDNTTKEDLTEVTLTQALLDSRRKNRQPVSLAGLRELITHSGDQLQRNLADSVTRARTDVERTVEKWRTEAERKVGRVLLRRDEGLEEGRESGATGARDPHLAPRGTETEPATERGGVSTAYEAAIVNIGGANSVLMQVMDRFEALENRIAVLERRLEAGGKQPTKHKRQRSESDES